MKIHDVVHEGNVVLAVIEAEDKTCRGCYFDKRQGTCHKSEAKHTCDNYRSSYAKFIEVTEQMIPDVVAHKLAAKRK